VWRVGYAGAPCELTPWEHCEWRHRFDDPLQQYRTLYCAERRLTALYEALSPFQPDSRAVEDFKEFIAAPPGRFSLFGRLPLEWRQKNELASGRLIFDGGLVDLTHDLTVLSLEAQISEILLKYGEKHLDHGVLRGGNRPLTQAVSRFLYDRGKVGIVYRSRIDDKRCVALFEGRARIVPDGHGQRLEQDFHLLLSACSRLKIDPSLHL
jgi:hypothetical protein